MQRIDLHIHSHASDGHFSPTEVVQMAASGRLDVIALTDHDTVSGVAEALAAADALPLRVVSGVEISTREEEFEFHILGYFIDHRAPSMLRHQDLSRIRRVERMQGMVARLQEMGVGVEYEDVARAAGPDASSIGRPHLARALLERGQTRSFAEAFDRYIGDRGPAYVRSDFPGVRDVIDAIREAGGVPVWAHPEVGAFDRFIRTFASWGLSGVECYRPKTAPAESHLFETAALQLGLFRTGGSDWHGSHKGPLGDFAVAYRDVRERLEAYLPAVP